MISKKLPQSRHSYFVGNLNIEDSMDWLAEVDRFFEYMETREEEKVTMVAYKLMGGTSA